MNLFSANLALCFERKTFCVIYFLVHKKGGGIGKITVYNEGVSV